MLKKMCATIERYRMLGGTSSERTKSVLVACSGGPDSMALLHGLSKLKDQYRISLAGFHLNHQLRGGESSADATFVRQVFQDLGIPVTIKSADVRKFAKTHKLSLEEAARKVRYDLLEATADAIQADRIALGHTLNDNAETVLLNLIRGSGHSGLSGIPPLRGRIIRPLIGIDRNDIIKFLSTNTIRYRLDTSNNDLRFPRNFIRHKIIPLALELNPRFLQAVSRTTEVMTTEENYLSQLTVQACVDVVIVEENGFYLDIPKLLAYNDSVKRRVLKQLKPDLDFKLIHRILEILEGRSGKMVTLPDGWKVVKEYDRLYMGKNRVGLPPVEKKLVIGGEIDYSGWCLTALLKNKSNLTNKPKECEIFDFNKIELPLIVRTRKPGDRFQPLGLGTKTKLKEVMINDKIPKRLRDSLPLLCDQAGILWVLGGRRSERAKVNSQTKKFLLVKALMKTEKKNENNNIDAD